MAEIIIMVMWLFTSSLMFTVWCIRYIIAYKKDTYYAKSLENHFTSADLETAYEKGYQYRVKQEEIEGKQRRPKEQQKSPVSLPEAFWQGYQLADPSDTYSYTDDRW